jgi:hypothetical protein
MISIPVLIPRVHRVRSVTFDKEPPARRPAIATVLPIEGREILTTAAQHMPRSQRVTAINKAINQVRRNHPQFFREEI